MKDKPVGKQTPQKFYDLTEKASRREDEGATKLARRLENDDSNEETNMGPPSESRDDWVDNKGDTSLDE
jgi:hypothetical protein